MMSDILRIAAVSSAFGLLLAAPACSQAQAQTIQASNAWARRAAAMSGMESMGSMGKTEKMGSDKDATGSMGKMEKMGSDKGAMGAMGQGGTGAVYVTLTNTGSQADALVSASTDTARAVELHEVQNEGGVMKMRPVKSIQVPAGGKVELKPGGYHLMLLDLKHDLKPGETVPVTLKFEHGAEVRIDAAVR
jgi:hypothetical protein